MAEKSITEGLKETCNKIVGHWYCEDIPQHFIFDLNDRLLGESKVIIINNKNDKPFEDVYGVYVHGVHDETLEYIYCFHIGQWFGKRYYEIMALTKDRLVVREYWMQVNSQYGKICTYKRITDTNAADEILKAIDSIE